MRAVEPSPPRHAGLRIADVVVRFDGVTALDGATISAAPGEILGVIGPNGAGKTTLFNVITGVYQTSSGDVHFDGRSLSGLRPHQITETGVARTFQNIRLLDGQSALANVLVAADCGRRDGALSALCGLPRTRRINAETHARARAALEFVGLGDRADAIAGSLSYGQQRLLELARALATQPRLLLLDEPAAGSNPAERAQLTALIRRVRATGCGILLIEHDMTMVMELCDRIMVLDFGRKIAEGTPREVQADPRVIRAYLGDADAA